MRFDVSELRDDDAVTACTWTRNQELISAGDDAKVLKWSSEGDFMEALSKRFKHSVTSMTVLKNASGGGAAVSGGSKQKGGKKPVDTAAGGSGDMIVLACTDGYMRFLNRQGREEKAIQVTDNGVAIIDVDCTADGSAIVTGGEDGTVKVWSRNGMLRSLLASASKPVYSACWSPNDDQVLYTCGHEIRICSTATDRKGMNWEAHSGAVLTVSWNKVTNLIVSGGEDRRYRVWDSFGRQLFCSHPLDHVITSVAWSPSGSVFAVGSYNLLRLCDKTGWSYHRECPRTGSINALKWSPDGTQIAAAGADDSLVLAYLVGQTISWEHIECTISGPATIRARDLSSDSSEILDFRDRICNMSLAFGYFVVATLSQIYVYKTNNFNTPHIFDCKGAVSTILQSTKHFLTVDSNTGIQIYSYDGRPVNTIKFPGLQVERLDGSILSLSSDSIAVLDTSDCKTVRLFDIRTGRAIGNGYSHGSEISQIYLSQSGNSLPERLLAIVDTNDDLYVTKVVKPEAFKFGSMVDSIAWCQKADILTALMDGQTVCWYYPQAAFVDSDLLEPMKVSAPSPEFGKRPRIHEFQSSHLVVRRADGALIHSLVSTGPLLLHKYVSSGKWEGAVRLCRFLKQDPLWASLAAMALNSKQLATAELSLSSLREVAKAQYISKIKKIPSSEGRLAELSVLRGEVEEAEKILLQAQPPLVYRAIKLNIKLFRWERALELAKKYRTHVETVVAYRRRHLQQTKRNEMLSSFRQLDNVKVDWDEIQKQKEEDKQKEAHQEDKKSSRSREQSEPYYEEDAKALEE